MQIKWLYVRNFRNFSELTVEFSPEVNELVGRNAQGKTSLLEAMYFCMAGGSFRTSINRELIKHDQEGFFIAIGFEKEEERISYELDISFDGTKRRVRFNRRPCESLSLLIGQLLGVTCTPEVQNLVKGSPHHRRHFLDLQLAQINPLYVHHLSRYGRALKQRNALLKARDLRTIEAWETELAHSATYITLCRKKVTGKLNVWLKSFFEELSLDSKKAALDLHYMTKVTSDDPEETKSYFLQEYQRRRMQELAFGSTLVGPHRDDLHFLRGAHALRDFASEGEIRLAALSLKLAEWQHVKEHTQTSPILLIDDFAAYLDKERTKKLFEIVSQFGQLFITAHAPSSEEVSAQKSVKTFWIEQGNCAVNQV